MPNNVYMIRHAVDETFEVKGYGARKHDTGRVWETRRKLMAYLSGCKQHEYHSNGTVTKTLSPDYRYAEVVEFELVEVKATPVRDMKTKKEQAEERRKAKAGIVQEKEKSGVSVKRKVEE